MYSTFDSSISLLPFPPICAFMKRILMTTLQASVDTSLAMFDKLVSPLLLCTSDESLISTQTQEGRKRIPWRPETVVIRSSHRTHNFTVPHDNRPLIFEALLSSNRSHWSPKLSIIHNPGSFIGTTSLTPHHERETWPSQKQTQRTSPALLATRITTVQIASRMHAMSMAQVPIKPIIPLSHHA